MYHRCILRDRHTTIFPKSNAFNTPSLHISSVYDCPTSSLIYRASIRHDIRSKFDYVHTPSHPSNNRAYTLIPNATVYTACYSSMYPTTHNLTTRPSHRHVYALVTDFFHLSLWPCKCPQNLLLAAQSSPKHAITECAHVQVTSALLVCLYTHV